MSAARMLLTLPLPIGFGVVHLVHVVEEFVGHDLGHRLGIRMLHHLVRTRAVFKVASRTRHRDTIIVAQVLAGAYRATRRNRHGTIEGDCLVQTLRNVMMEVA